MGIKVKHSRRSFLRGASILGAAGVTALNASEGGGRQTAVQKNKSKSPLSPKAPRARVAEPASPWGSPAPDWLRKADMYNGQYFAWTEEQFERSKPFPAIVTPDHTKKSMDRLLGYGVHPVCYVQECTIASLKRRAEIIKNQPAFEDNEAYGYVHRTPFYKFVDVDVHPDFVWVDEKNQGLERRRDFEGGYGGSWDGWRQSCPNAVGFREAFVNGVKAVMELGVSGVFLDSFGTNDGNKCYGPEFGAHKHEHPELSTYEADLLLLKGVYEAVKSYGEDKVVWINGGRPDAPTLKYADAQMMESIICTHVSTRRWHTFAQVQQMTEKRQEALKAGKVITPLSYVGYTKYEPAEDSFYCFAVARVMGLLWADWFTAGDSRGTMLYKLRLGGTRSEMLESNGMYYRLFNNGVVVVNPTDDARELNVKTGFAFLRDVLTNRRYSPHDESKGWTLETGMLQVIIPPQSGRVFVAGFSS